MAVSSRIFISYRREDASAYAGRLYDRLIIEFPDQVFMDIDTLEPGVDFVQHIEDSVGSVDVLIAVIGRGWVSAVDKDGRRRLDQPDDFVRLEVGSALRRNIRVIPVLVGGAPFPEAEELPEDLDALRRRSGLVLSDLEWKAGTERLLETIRRVLTEQDVSEDEIIEQVQADVQETRVTPQEEGSGAELSLPGAVLPLGLAGAALLTIGLFMRWDKGGHSFLQNDFGGNLPHGGAFTALAPIGIVVAAVLGVLLARKPDTRALGAGALLGAGIAGAAKYIHALLAAEGSPGATLGVLGAFVGSGLLLAAGLLAARATPAFESPRCVNGAIAGIAGAALMLIAIAIPFNGGTARVDAQKVSRSFDEAIDPVLTSVVIAILAALLLRPWRHSELSAALLTLGALDGLLWVRYLGVPVFEDSSVGSFGAGGVVGLAGAGLVLLSGYLGLQGTRVQAVPAAAVQP